MAAPQYETFGIIEPTHAAGATHGAPPVHRETQICGGSEPGQFRHSESPGHSLPPPHGHAQRPGCPGDIARHRSGGGQFESIVQPAVPSNTGSSARTQIWFGSRPGAATQRAGESQLPAPVHVRKQTFIVQMPAGSPWALQSPSDVHPFVQSPGGVSTIAGWLFQIPVSHSASSLQSAYIGDAAAPGP